jgi:hypothetical protein
MSNRPELRITYANVIATLALVVALGLGTAYAAGLGRNVVKSRNIAPGAVKASDLGKRSVGTAKIAPRAVTGARIAADTITGANLDEATLGTVPNAADSKLLGGLDPAAFVRGTGRARAVVGSDPQGGDPSPPVGLDIGGSFSLACGNPASIGSDFTFKNTSGGPLEIWTDKLQQEFPPPTTQNHTVLPNGAATSIGVPGPVVSSGAALVRFTIASTNRVTLVEARIANSAGRCTFPLLITELRAG